MKHLQEVHTVAERYLRDLKSGKARFYSEPESIDNLVPLADALTERVVVMRNQKPEYFIGFKSSGRPVFTHDLKLAVSYDSASLTLIDILRRLDGENIEVETMPAAWFSSYQNG